MIAVGVVYNNARIALAERAWELASLRVLGFTRAEVSALLLGELALVIAVALPLGMALGWGLVHVVAELLQSDQFCFPVVIQPRTYAWAAHLRAGGRRGQRAGRAPAHRPARHGGRPEDEGMNTMKKRRSWIYVARRRASRQSPRSPGRSRRGRWRSSSRP